MVCRWSHTLMVVRRRVVGGLMIVRSDRAGAQHCDGQKSSHSWG
ncbi:hypothetical protein B932_0593 [Gluconobacter oxydans H24]|nr:hypothetical protein B932_0593 [Gluconobacter oxydans H24]